MLCNVGTDLGRSGAVNRRTDGPPPLAPPKRLRIRDRSSCVRWNFSPPACALLVGKVPKQGEDHVPHAWIDAVVKRLGGTASRGRRAECPVELRQSTTQLTYINIVV